jgi:hypothetical protein
VWSKVVGKRDRPMGQSHILIIILIQGDEPLSVKMSQKYGSVLNRDQICCDTAMNKDYTDIIQHLSQLLYQAIAEREVNFSRPKSLAIADRKIPIKLIVVKKTVFLDTFFGKPQPRF